MDSLKVARVRREPDLLLVSVRSLRHRCGRVHSPVRGRTEEKEESLVPLADNLWRNFDCPYIGSNRQPYCGLHPGQCGGQSRWLWLHATTLHTDIQPASAFVCLFGRLLPLL